MKVCTRCSELKPPDEFPPNKYRPAGRQSYCRACNASIVRESRSNGRPPRRVEHYRRAFKSGCYTGSLEEYSYWIEHRNLKYGNPANWMPNAFGRLQAIANKTDSPVRRHHGEGWWVYPNTWSVAQQYRWRYHNDPAFMLWERQRRQFKKWISGERNAAPLEVSYSREELKLHIERQFVKGMTWDNYGEWHIDHIVPKNLFDPRDSDHVQTCWDLPNLRPLWASVNHGRSKQGDTLI